MPEKSFPESGNKDKSITKHIEKHVSPEIENITDVLREYGKPVAVGIVLALAIFIGYTAYQYMQHTEQARATALLTRATSVEDLEHILAEYGDTDAAPMALQSLAAEHFRNARYEQALDHYTRFLEKYPTHDMAADARIGLAYSHEAMGLIDKALESFSEFAEQYPDHYMAPLAIMGRARCMSLEGRHEEAIGIYEKFIDENPESPWLSEAETALLHTERKKRKAQETD